MTATELYQPHNILLTGGAGFIGSNVMCFLARKYPQYKFVCLDKLDSCASVNNFKELQAPQFTFVRGDICNATLVVSILKEHQIDTVMHFAAQTHVDNSFGDSLTFTESNVLGTHVLLESVRGIKEQIKRFIHVSTDEVYGEVDQNAERCTVEAALAPTNPYAATKTAAEYLVKSYRTSFNLPSIITRSNNVFGPKQYPEKLIPKFINLLKRQQPCPLHGSGHNRRSYLYVEDVAAAFDAILHKGTLGAVYNIGSEEELENIDVMHKLIGIFRKKNLLEKPNDSDYITHVRDRAFNDFRYHIDSQAVNALGWERKYLDFDTALLATVEWYLQAADNHWDHVERALAAHPHFTVKSIAGPLPNNVGMSTSQSSGYINEPGNRTPNTPNSEVANNKFWQPEYGQNTVTPQYKSGHEKLTWLIYGQDGWIGQQFVGHLKNLRPDDTIVRPTSRADNDVGVAKDLDTLKPDRVISLLGRTHGPGFTTIDYLEQKGKLVENIRDNLFSPLILSLLCGQRNIHFTYLGTGCIFKYDDLHPRLSGKGFYESDLPNFFGSSYSTVKGFTDRLFPYINKHALNVRIRMPITADDSPRNFITKITTYAKICSIDNSMTVLPELLPVMIHMAVDREQGTVNLTNPGCITHNKILEMYREIIDPSFKWENFSEEEQAKILASDRSNNLLHTDKLQKYWPSVQSIEDAVKTTLVQMKQNRANKKSNGVNGVHSNGVSNGVNGAHC